MKFDKTPERLPDQIDGYEHAEYNGILIDGIGNTYVATSSTDLPAAQLVRQIAGHDESGDDAFELVNLQKAYYVGGCLIGGYSDGALTNLTTGIFEHDAEDWYSESLQEQKKLLENNIKPIFRPSIEGFNLETGLNDHLRAAQVKVYIGLLDNKLSSGPNINNLSDLRDPEVIDKITKISERLATYSVPSFEVEVKGKPLLVSLPYLNDGSRPEALVWSCNLDEVTKVTPTVYYQSKSHGVWRALLRQTQNGWYTKGMFGDENSADAPLGLQKALSMLPNPSEDRDVPFYDSHNLHLPTPLIADNDGDWDRYDAIEYAQVDLRVAGIRGYDNIDTRNDPDNELGETKKGITNLFLPKYVPDLSKTLDSWQVMTGFYGLVDADVYLSKNKQISYLVYTSHRQDGRAQRWIASAEIVRASIGKNGLSDSWPSLPEAVTKPPIEYEHNPTGEAYYDQRRHDSTQFERFVVKSLASHRTGHKRG